MKLDQERCQVWEEFGARGVLPRVVRGHLPPGTAYPCDMCKEGKQQIRNESRMHKKEKQALLGKHPDVEKPRLQIKDGFLQKGVYALIAADCRKKWQEYLTDDNTKP